MQDWNDPQLSDGDMPQPKYVIHVDELNDYLRILADQTIDIRHKLVLLEGYIDTVKKLINEL
jgi:hypothetical protein